MDRTPQVAYYITRGHVQSHTSVLLLFIGAASFPGYGLFFRDLGVFLYATVPEQYWAESGLGM